MQSPVLQMIDITKTFAGTVALSKARLTVGKGEVLGLIGENGAGKSTLMNVLMGVHQPDGGKILLDGNEVQNHSPSEALHRGIGMVPQELNLMPDLSIAENIFVGNYRTTRGLFNLKKTQEDAQALLATLGMKMDVTQKVSEISPAFQQLVSIARTLSFKSQIIIFDEPTACLTASEAEKLFEIILQLKSSGRSIIYISHHLDEIQRITDQVTIMRDGHTVCEAKTSSLSKEDMIFHMANQKVETVHKQKRDLSGEICMEVKNFSKGKEFRDISFQVKQAEILGFAGLVGSGRTELFNALLGVTRPDSGEVYIDGAKAEIRSCADSIRYGMALVPEERRKQGIFPDLSVAENLIQPSYSQHEKNGLIDFNKTRATVKKHVDSLRVKTASVDTLIKNLSGGNQQKVILGRWMAKGVRLLVLDEPTRGIDVRAKGEIYKLITEMAENGVTVVVISSEIEELLMLADRIVVMRQGRIKGEIDDPCNTTREDVLRLAMQ